MLVISLYFLYKAPMKKKPSTKPITINGLGINVISMLKMRIRKECEEKGVPIPKVSAYLRNAVKQIAEGKR
jgi:hypothetical protein